MKKIILIALTSLMITGCYKDDGSYGNTSTSRECGFPLKNGKYCTRIVSGGGYCWQHK
jgi:hypothetical protein